ncbi:MAG: SdpI family protein [Microbacteriaceae bacterium]
MTAVIGLMVGVLGLGGAGLFMVRLAGRSARGELERNYLVGVRTKAALVSDEAWFVAQREGAPLTRRAGYGLWVAAVACLAGAAVSLGVFGPVSADTLAWGMAVAILGSSLWCIVWSLRACVRGNRAAAALLGWSDADARMRFSDWFTV